MRNLVTTREAAERLGISRRRVQELLQAGALRGEKLSRDWVIEAEEVEAFAKKERPRGRPPKKSSH
jgi:excisionase family DNA binding protein